ncbi:MAG: cob(I)yrinic acid a,c-diamide adenosyltransferase [Lachnospiraceae bacterium]|nr:cob(I)yrinic acid a,c-diamide adenosyltransferase [Lachnospiraceae bacterium]MCI9185703.1 cob(I)yrinic acid a,c-diamide adenosyltransferase [Lachnospiraceae bacterium]
MNTGRIEIIYGDGGKTAMALGKGLVAAANQKDVVVIRFLKGGQMPEGMEVVRRLEPEMSVFCFEKSSCDFAHLPKEARQEEQLNILNAFHYARKVLTTGECDMLILDGALGLLDQGILLEQELIKLLESRSGTDVLLTGKTLPQGLASMADQIEKVSRA